MAWRRPGWRRSNAGILSIGYLGTNFNEISIEIQTLSFKKMRFKMSSVKWRPFCLGLNVLMCYSRRMVVNDLPSPDVVYTRCHVDPFKPSIHNKPLEYIALINYVIYHPMFYSMIHRVLWLLFFLILYASFFEIYLTKFTIMTRRYTLFTHGLSWTVVYRMLQDEWVMTSNIKQWIWLPRINYQIFVYLS